MTSSSATESGTPNRLSYTLEEVEEVCARVRNWGRWGDDDQIGTLNFIDEACVEAAARLVKKGKVITCGLPYDDNGPQKGDFGRINPLHMMVADGGDVLSGAQDNLPRLRYADDVVFMPLQCGTQWDALSHIFYENQMYNGYPVRLVNSRGTSKNGVEMFRDRLVGRGLLFDIPAHRGLPWLEPGDGIGGPELEESRGAKASKCERATLSWFGPERCAGSGGGNLGRLCRR